MSLLKIRSVSVSFGGLAALKKVDVDIRQGEIVGLIGPNGAGKTTLFNCLSGFQATDEGTIQFQDEALHRLPPHRIAALGLARTFQTSRIFKRMTVLDHVLLGRHRQQKAGLWGRPDPPGLGQAGRRGIPEPGAQDSFVLRGAAFCPASPISPIPFPMQTAAGSRSPGPWSPSQGSCCWTSRPPA